ncbi:MAG: hypothetical protein Hyperionvirus4_35 [Hyperionvirus sp.]|uniref:F-box domain-containing protein n=1 Tax=Hyperionvirus sp. TaxID=2487770 RepID=A0A3G5A735_9VIRU|nr:MAG: hypothetical protein Hyperionvirus4_35 [Hyperionvirus sp.]
MIACVPRCLMELVLSLLEPRDLSRTARVCTKWRSCSENDIVWKAYVLYEWDISTATAARIAYCPPHGTPEIAAYDGVQKEASWKIRCQELMRIRENKKKKRYDVIKLHGHTEPITATFCTVDFAFSCSRDKTIRIWVIATRICLHVLRGHTGSINQIHVDGDEVISGSEDGTIRVWSVQNGREKRCFRTTDHTGGASINVMKFICSHDRIFSGGPQGEVFVWDRVTGEPVKVLLMPFQNGASARPPVTCIDVGHNKMAVGLGNAVFIYDQASLSLTLKHGNVSLVRILREDKYVLTFSSCYVHIFNLRNGDLMQSYLIISSRVTPILETPGFFGKLVLETGYGEADMMDPGYLRMRRLFFSRICKYNESITIYFTTHACNKAYVGRVMFTFVDPTDGQLAVYDYAAISKSPPTRESRCVIS